MRCGPPPSPHNPKSESDQRGSWCYRRNSGRATERNERTTAVTIGTKMPDADGQAIRMSRGTEQFGWQITESERDRVSGPARRGEAVEGERESLVSLLYSATLAGSIAATSVCADRKSQLILHHYRFVMHETSRIVLHETSGLKQKLIVRLSYQRCILYHGGKLNEKRLDESNLAYSGPTLNVTGKRTRSFRPALITQPGLSIVAEQKGTVSSLSVVSPTLMQAAREMLQPSISARSDTFRRPLTDRLTGLWSVYRHTCGGASVALTCHLPMAAYVILFRKIKLWWRC
ncbi:hypothetical protein J6590_064240 [Homalodisca vitripennis]|nr:hypothetical protein J6590_064240 [Homalodisca vitripennis]